jgi:hypothetical protein
MSDVRNVLAARTLGETIPVSIPTANALDAISKAGKMDVVWINVGTLVRNLHDCIESDQRPALTGNAIADEVIHEMGIINQVIAEMGYGVTYYILGYQDLARKFPFAKLRVQRTEKQIQRQTLMDDAIKRIMALDEGQTIEYDKGSEVRGEPKRALIITHYCVDLLSRMKFTKLRLLESYTGNVKQKSEWNTKLTDGKGLVHIPFNRFTLQIFGDNYTHFDPFPHQVRKAIMEMSVSMKWSPLTTVDKIRYSIDKLRDRYTAVQMLKML